VFAPRYVFADGRAYGTFLVDDDSRSQQSCQLGNVPRPTSDAVPDQIGAM
jgi:hypothetical protein